MRPLQDIETELEKADDVAGQRRGTLHLLKCRLNEPGRAIPDCAQETLGRLGAIEFAVLGIGAPERADGAVHPGQWISREVEEAGWGFVSRHCNRKNH